MPGFSSRMLWDTGSFDDSSIWLEFLSESIVQDIPILNSAGFRGTRTHASERNRSGNETVRGTIEMEASRIALDNILPAALGAAESSNIFNVAETIPEFNLLIDKVTDIALVTAAKINRFTLRGSQGGIIGMSLDVEAESITWGQSWPSPAPTPDVSKPYFFSDLGDVTIESAARKLFDFEIVVDNVLIVDQFANNLTRDSLINSSDRIVTVRLSVPAEGNSGLISTTVSGEQVSLVLTNAEEASSVLTALLGRLSFTTGKPVVNSKGQLVIPMEGQSRGIGHAGATAPDIRITNAHA
ncbi:hypothetical protein KOR42_22660 [Thalassoglobus neptunius]|uniref:Uncharacterized protein n=1 Tax=Thalassoglobus neptunius TaxID=1938619 RepID=A0A5C5X851_9PLAN|nr:phage tail tube protein [Thalassoglobus neptunius]TWT58879.1 hypothetical protein KOR42_22660 [Thalassoglobus neptunius]